LTGTITRSCTYMPVGPWRISSFLLPVSCTTPHRTGPYKRQTHVAGRRTNDVRCWVKGKFCLFLCKSRLSICPCLTDNK
jgi:hypothetical protein